MQLVGRDRAEPLIRQVVHLTDELGKVGLSRVQTFPRLSDPDGRAVYLNPCFESCFGISSDSVRGQPLASMFQGGAREAILGAMADVCGGSGTSRFLLREAGRGFSAIASPISSKPSSIVICRTMFL